MRFLAASRAAGRLQPAADRRPVADPVRLKALRVQCAADRTAAGEDACLPAADAFRRRFVAGETGPDEFRTLADLPPIPPSFDSPISDRAPCPSRGRAMNDVTVIDRFLATFSRYIDSGFGLLQGEVAFLTATLIVIDMTIAGLYWAMSHATDQGDDVIAKLLRKVLYVGAFAYIINNFNWLASIVFRSFAGLGLTASGSTMSMGEFLQPGRLAKTGIDAAAPFLSRSATWRASRSVREHDAHRGHVPPGGGDPVFLRAGDPAFHHADRVQTDHARGLRAGAVRAVEQDQLPRREGAGQRGVLGHQGAGAGRHRRHRLGPVCRVRCIRPSRPSTMQWSSCWPRSRCWRWGSSGRALPPGWYPVHRSLAQARWPVLRLVPQARRLP